MNNKNLVKILLDKINLPRNTSERSRGFTLMELLVVIGIIGLLSTLIVAAVKTAKNKAKITKAKHDIDAIYTAIASLGNDTNEWPVHQAMGSVHNVNNNEVCSDGCSHGLSDSESGIVATDGVYSGWAGPYMRAIPEDAWGNEYFFDTDYLIDIDDNPCGCGGGGCHNAVVLGSYGPDGSGNNQYNCDDIIKIIVE